MLDCFYKSNLSTCLYWQLLKELNSRPPKERLYTIPICYSISKLPHCVKLFLSTIYHFTEHAYTP